jgi:succinate dehydrogenase / fumarate reductase membrane anchor subunit
MSTLKANGAGWWLFQRVSGVALVVLLLLHFTIMHFSGLSLDYVSVSAHLASNLWKTVDLCFLILATGHGLYGVWIISGDYLHQPWLRLGIFIACGLAGLVMLTMGVITVVSA